MLTIHIEVVLKEFSADDNKNKVQNVVLRYMEIHPICPNSVITSFSKQDDPKLHDLVKCIIVDDIPNYDQTHINFESVKIKWHIYSLDHSGPSIQSEEGSDEHINIATHLMLPSAELVNLWENLYYENEIKENLLSYAETMMKFSDNGVDNNIVSCNKVILLHGPPGTGKTSLCKALAQKLSIRMQDRFSSGILIEINSHSLFSKWFSESGKLVTKMFSSIIEIVQNSKMLVCILIDEVESLAHARDQCISGTEPSDAIRVVNAVLTQLDQIKRYSNVLIFTTSNLTQSIDLAFVDRADIKQYLGLPTLPAIYKVFSSCIYELAKTNIIHSEIYLDPISTIMKSNAENLMEYSRKLVEICDKSSGLSGRSLRKIPFIAHALFLNEGYVSLGEFLRAMEQAVQREKCERKLFEIGVR